MFTGPVLATTCVKTLMTANRIETDHKPDGMELEFPALVLLASGYKKSMAMIVAWLRRSQTATANALYRTNQ